MVFRCLVPKMTLKEEYKEHTVKMTNQYTVHFRWLHEKSIATSKTKNVCWIFRRWAIFFCCSFWVDILLIRYTRNGGLLLILMTIVMTRRKGYKIKTRSNNIWTFIFFTYFSPKMKATASDTECNQTIVNRCKLIR